MDTVTITKARMKEVDSIYRLYRACTAEMLANGIIQWHDDYPRMDDVIEDIQNQSMYCMKDDETLIGAVTFDEKQDKQYEAISWKFTQGRVGVVHRLAVHPDFQEQGFARALMDFVRDHALENNYQIIRLDAFSRNPRILNFYRNRGYHQTGEVFFAPLEEPFYCFEKIISQQ